MIGSLLERVGGLAGGPVWATHPGHGVPEAARTNPELEAEEPPLIWVVLDADDVEAAPLGGEDLPDDLGIRVSQWRHRDAEAELRRRG